MKTISKFKTGFAAAALAIAMGTTALVALPAPAAAQSAKDGRLIVLSIGRGQQVNLGSAITDVVVSDPAIADVEVKSGKQIYILGKGPGETTVYATDASGRTVYQATVRVGTNLDSVGQMLLLAMPEADIKVTTMNGVVLLTGTVANPEDAAEAEMLVKAFTGGATQVVSRLKNATPLQINLQVRVAEVSRSLSKEITGNLQTFKSGTDSSGAPYAFGVARARDFISDTGQLIYPQNGNTIAGLGRLFGIDIGAAFDLSEKAGLVSTLANPNLTTVSGETAEFLAGGSFPIVSASSNGTSVEYKTYGVNLTYTPIVLSDGRISLRLRTEVSDISSQGAVRLAGIEIPATTTRMAETTVELGSGQSIMIAGLLSNQMGSSVDKMPGAGDIPVLGALFKSNGWRRNETELMIVITPYLVKPVSDSEIMLPTDGLHSPHDLERILMSKVSENKGDKARPMPTIAPSAPNGPEMTSVSEAAPALSKKTATATAQADTGPGFSFDN
ncbi:MAG: type II and III secretion system protein family protein [Sphingorhabdus sp.]